MARVKIVKPESVSDPIIREIFSWVTEMEGAVPNHFYVEMNFPEYMKAKLGSTRVLWEAGELSMEEIQHVGILVSRANGCDYCTAAFCTVLDHGLNAGEDYVQNLVTSDASAIAEQRLRTLLEFALKVNHDAKGVTDKEVDDLKAIGLSDKGVVQLIHLVSDFASYNRLNLALKTDFDYKPVWSGLANK